MDVFCGLADEAHLDLGSIVRFAVHSSGDDHAGHLKTGFGKGNIDLQIVVYVFDRNFLLPCVIRDHLSLEGIGAGFVYVDYVVTLFVCLHTSFGLNNTYVYILQGLAAVRLGYKPADGGRR